MQFRSVVLFSFILLNTSFANQDFLCQLEASSELVRGRAKTVHDLSRYRPGQSSYAVYAAALESVEELILTGFLPHAAFEETRELARAKAAQRALAMAWLIKLDIKFSEEAEWAALQFLHFREMTPFLQEKGMVRRRLIEASLDYFTEGTFARRARRGELRRIQGLSQRPPRFTVGGDYVD